jgi:SHS2 domain-containing protein
MSSKENPAAGADEPLFREIEHTGDLGIELTAPTRVELFRRAAIALAALLVEPVDVVARESRSLAAQADNDIDLMHDFLTELLQLFTVEAFIWREATVTENGKALHVTVRGETFDSTRHNFRGEIKAVTYHQLTVENTPGGWQARIIFDV